MRPSRASLAIGGMTCAGCVAHIERALRAVPGVRHATVNLATGTARVESGERAVDESALLAAVAHAGYTASVMHDDGAASAPPAEVVAGWRVALALGLAAPLLAPMLAAPFGWHVMLPASVQCALAAPVQFWLGARFYRSAWRALRAGMATMDVLVALGTTAAFGSSLALWASRGASADLYFESAAVVIALVLLGKWLEARARRSTLAALAALRELRPALAHVRRSGRVADVPLGDVGVGDEVLVRPGERAPVDGEVLEGASHFDEALLTGESLPVLREVGDRVTGGALNGEGVVVLRTTAIGTETTLAQIIRLVEDAQAEKAPIQEVVDRIAGWFVPVVLAIGAATFAAWWALRGDATLALQHAVAVLVVACPCALGLATPVTLMVGLGIAARRGILVRDARALEVLRDVRAIAFDKTGTLTLGRPRLVELVPAAGITRTEALELAAALQAQSDHPLARAVRDAARGESLAVPEARDVVAVAGRGVEGAVGDRRLLLGSPRWLREFNFTDAALEQSAEAAAARGHTIAWLAEPLEQRALAVLAFGDSLKPEAPAALARLHALGVQTILLSGDHPAAAAAAGRALGIASVQAEVSPAGKADALRTLRATLGPGARVAMVGDGINDAPALAAADVGIAMATGTDVAMATAGLTLMRGDVGLVPDVLALSRAITRKVRQNLFFAFAYNALGIPLAAAGALTPMFAGAAMALSSVSVVTNALLLGRLPVPGLRILDQVRRDAA